MTSSPALDPAFVSLLSDPRVALHPPAPGVPLADYRRRLDRPMAAVTGPEMWSVHSTRTGGVALRVYRPAMDARGVILFVHGGGFVTGSLDTHDALCRSLARSSGAAVVAVDYRLAPEAPFPAALNDCAAALQWVLDDRGLDTRWISICGDSAGGHLATMTALHAARSGVRLHALGLFYPVVGPACATRSWQTLGTGHMLTRGWMRWAWQCYCDEANASPGDIDLLAMDLALLPRTHILTAAFDPLQDEGKALAAAIRATGGQATEICYAGMIHGFASLPMLTPLANEAIAQMASALSST